MSAHGKATAGLIPVADRVRWLLFCRAGLVAALIGARFATSGGKISKAGLVAAGLGWLALTCASPVLGRLGRTTARAALTVSLLGDGVLLAIGWWALGGLAGQVGHLVVLHAVAVTLLASFRTGTKIALWHSVLALLFLEATAAGLLGPAVPVPLATFGGYLAAIWITVLATASFAAMNERELRRRRYDSEVLRALGLAVAPEHDPTRVASLLARFAQDELQASRCAVAVQPRDGAGSETGGGFVVTIAADGAVNVHRRPTGVPAPAGPPATLLSRRLDPDRQAWLTTLMPDARNVIEVPFDTEEASGVLVVEYPKRSPQRSSQRVERRVVNTAEQATAHAGVAIGRAILTDRIRTAAETDGLTGVANRRRFDSVLEAELRRATQVAVLLVDLDHFKSVNDEHGHLVGDEVLRQAAHAIQAVTGDRGMVARYGGEEFAVILTGVDEATALDIAERTRHAIATAPTSVPITASLGVAGCPLHGRSTAHLLAAADAALYEAKRTGRDRAVLAPPEAGQPGILFAA
jgi:two-component system, cell cycle response regulator